MTQTLVVYAVLSVAGFAGLSVLAYVLHRRGQTQNPSEAWWRSAGIIIAVALLVRLLVIFTTTPELSDDYKRYVHDGRVQVLMGENPYATPPAQSTLYHDGVGGYTGNNADLVTIYQPTSQAVFGALAFVEQAFGRAASGDGAGGRVFRLGFVLFDMLAIVLLLLALRDTGRSAWWAVLYAWHPLAISETAWSGHQDVIGIALMLGALLLTARVARHEAGPLRWRSVLGAGLLLAMAVAVKPLVLPLALPMAWALRQRWRAIPVAAGACLAGLVVLYLPYALWSPGLGGMLETVEVFVDKWASNASAHRAFEIIIGSKSAADLLAGGLLFGVLVTATFSADLWRAAVVYLLAAVLLSSTAHPWYLLWMLALLPMRFTLTGWVLSLTITLAYTAWLNEAEFQPLRWAVWVAYLPVYAVLVFEIAWWVKGRFSTPMQEPL